ncbi:MAG: hypothetical protein AABX07_01430 [Nanoarchaeota archaeon]
MGLAEFFKVSTLKTIALIVLIILSFVILNITILITCEAIADKSSSRALNFCSGKWSDVPLFIFFWPLLLGDYIDKFIFDSMDTLPLLFEVAYIFIISYFTYIMLKSNSY